MNLYKNKIIVRGNSLTIMLTLLQILLHLLCCFFHPNPNTNPLFDKFIGVVMNDLEYKSHEVGTNSS